MSRYINLTGQVFGRLTVLEQAGRTKQGAVKWKCLCECGTQVIVSRNNLRSGTSQSCGCLQRELQSERARTHGLSHTRTYRIWFEMQRRCGDRGHHAYKDYGGRGITVCERWQSFGAFLEDMGEAPKGLSLDRRDNDRGYSPENCRWATQTVQCRNKRNNRLLTFEGKTQCSKAWAEELKIPRTRIEARIDRLGWSVEDALTIPSWGTKRGQTRKTVAAPEQALYKQDISPSDI